jgi:uncharacterized membrane protein
MRCEPSFKSIRAFYLFEVIEVVKGKRRKREREREKRRRRRRKERGSAGIS